MRGVIKTVVEKKLDSRNFPDLMADPLCQFMPDLTAMGTYLFQHHFLVVDLEKTEVHPRQTEIGRNFYFTHSNKGIAKKVTCCCLKDLSQIFLYQTGKFFLSLCFHAANIKLIPDSFHPFIDQHEYQLEKQGSPQSGHNCTQFAVQFFRQGYP